MQVKRISSTAELAALAGQWTCLARGVPFRSWQWLIAWWRHFGQRGELFVLSVRDPRGTLVGIAPWYMQRCGARGRVLRFLGSGEVCSDYLSILSTPEHEEAVTAAIAQWLSDAASPHASNGARNNNWDLLELTGLAACDCAAAKLVAHLVDHGNAVHRRNGMNCWRIELPETWDEYVAGLSKSHRKQVRRVERRLLETGRAVLKTAANGRELQLGMKVLVDLHQRRRQSLGEPGCFSSPQFSEFLEEAAERMLDVGCVQLHWVELDGRPVAAEIHLTGGGVTYAYQAGVAPDVLDEEPGRIINIATLKKAIEDGQRGFDFLRGDEPYKAHWRAQPRPLIELRVVPRRAVPRIRHGVWLAGSTMKNWIKGSINLAGMH
jgi:CelD/BcsL family acetyltransferase involved in cellulose biosynthesis